MTAFHWYEPMRDAVSLGSQTKRPGSLAGLAQARREHKGQFFTPDALALYVWKIALPAMEGAYQRSHGTRVSILDNSVGSGRLLQYAEPEKHELYGIDIDADTVARLGHAATAAGFTCEIISEGMENARAKDFSVALINPAFSLNLVSPNLFPYPCTTWGRFGKNTSTLSHAYALHQALDAADIVVAILPSTYAAEVVQSGQFKARLRAQFKLPKGCFSEEGTQVSVDILTFAHGDAHGKFEVIDVKSLDEDPADLGLICHARQNPKLKSLEITDDKPTITMPVTGVKKVRVAHDGRKIKLKFQCGLTQAKVLNAVLAEPIERMDDHRHPKRYRYKGQGKLDLQVHLLQDDPMLSFETLVAEIANAGGEPDVDVGLVRYLKRLIGKTERQLTPFRHDVERTYEVGSSGRIKGTARKAHVVNPKVWGSPAIQAGQVVEFTKEEGGNFYYVVRGQTFLLAEGEMYQRFEMEAMQSASSVWATIHPGLHVAYPELAQQWRERAKKAGIASWLDWKYQWDDLIELSMKPSGAIAAWQMGLGKARLAVALCLLSGCKHNLIAVEAYALPETRAELESLPVDKSEWQVIDSPDKLTSLKRINLITISRLRMPVSDAQPKMTYAKRMRRRIGTMVVDEGHFMSNMDTDQSRACFAVCAKKRYTTTGTPIANYPRNILPILTWVAGDGTATQPYGEHHPYLEPALINSAQYAMRGVEKFKDDFVTLEWVTSEFAENLRDGAKREIPKIANLAKYRQMIAPHVKRRLNTEPDVTPYVKIPKPSRGVIEVEWDQGHLGHYLRVADHFAEWFLKARGKDGKKGGSLIALLARINAVAIACNYPQHEGAMASYGPLTSKQRAAIEWAERMTREGHKSIIFAENPGNLERMHRELAKRGIEAVVFHGGIPVEQRCRTLNERFRFGPAPVLLASFGVTQSSLNIWQANRVLMFNRDWSAKTEEQAIFRVCRPQQKRDIRVDYLHLKGSIDEYQAQMVAFKAECANTGLDWATPVLDDVEFLHLDTLLGRFVEDLAAMHGMKGHQFRDLVKGPQQLELLA